MEKLRHKIKSGPPSDHAERQRQIGQAKNQRRTVGVSLLLLILVTTCVYVNSVSNAFVFDDVPLIVGDPKVREIRDLPHLLWASKRDQPVYRAVRTLSYAIDHAFSGFNPVGYHISNILYHTVTSLLVFNVVLSLTGALPAAIASGLLFAVHPIQTDAVTYLSGRRDLLAGLFVLLGFHAFIRYRQTNRRWYLGLALTAYVLGFFSKEMAITLPLLWLAYDVIWGPMLDGESSPASPRWWTRRLWSALARANLFYLSIFAVAGALAFYVIILMPKAPRTLDYYGGSPSMTLLTVARISAHYVKLILFPVTLSADYSYNAFPVTDSWADPSAWLAILTLALIGYGLVRLVSYSKAAAFGGLWFFLTLLPVSHLIPHHELMAEHYLYLPLFGFALLLGALLVQWARRQRQAKAIYALFGVVILLFSVRTIMRNRDWKDELTLWTKTVQAAPASARAQTNLGLALMERKMYPQAEQALKRALQIDPSSGHLHNALGLLYASIGRADLAEQAFQEAVRREPDSKITTAAALQNLGMLYLRRGRTAEAKQAFLAALKKNRHLANSWMMLAKLHLEQGRTEEAEQALTRAVREQPNLASARLMLAQLYLMRNSPERAEVEAHAALRAEPTGARFQEGLAAEQRGDTPVDAAAAHGILAQTYAARGMLAEAEAAAKEALRLQQSRAESSFGGSRHAATQPRHAQVALGRDDPATAPYHYVLGVIYRRRGKTTEAASEMQAALRLNPRFGAAREALKALGTTGPAR